MSLNLLNTLLLPVGILGCIYAFFIYIKGNKGWWKSDIGKLLLTMSGALGLIYTYSLVIRIWPNIPGRPVITTALNVFTIGVILWRAVILTRLRIVAKDNNVRILKKD
jgi:hypothetical protein